VNKRIFQLIAAGLISLMSCSKEKLPKATQQGKNTFGCKIDGKVFLPSEEGSSWIGAPSIIVSNSSFDGFIIYAVNFSSQLHSSVSLALPYLKKAGAYNLHTYGYGEYKLEYFGGAIYRTNTNYTGTINITRCDTVNKIYSGTFSFTAIDDNTGKTVNVTEGRFDVKR
jgi:hypothetical protein